RVARVQGGRGVSALLGRQEPVGQAHTGDSIMPDGDPRPLRPDVHGRSPLDIPLGPVAGPVAVPAGDQVYHLARPVLLDDLPFRGDVVPDVLRVVPGDVAGVGHALRVVGRP